MATKNNIKSQINTDVIPEIDQLLGSARIGTWEWDLDTDNIKCHPSYRRLTGYGRSDTFPKNEWLPCVLPSDVSTAKQNIVQSIHSGSKAIEVKFRVTYRNASLRWHLCRGMVIKSGPEGQIHKMIFVNIDITEIHQLLKRMEDSANQLQTILKIIPGLIYRIQLNQDTPHVYVSRQSENILGYSDVEAFIYRVRGKVHPDDQDEVNRIVDEALEAHKPFEIVSRISVFGGEWKWYWERGVGVYDDHGTPVAIEGFLMDIANQHTAEAELRKENMLLKSSMQVQYRFQNIIGKSAAMQTVYKRIVHAASSDANVIIYGESGTGKELVAKAIHNLSDRKNRKFIAVNCGGIPETLIEREFFGHMRGTFSGADEDKKGYLDAADGATLFLDEVGEISLNMQVTLLRVLDGYGFNPVGGQTLRTPDIRIIAATNKNLKKMVKEGLIREDFYYRIHILPIRLPALRERKEDIPLLVDNILKNNPDNHEPASLAPSFLDALMHYDWPGNVRELQNVVHRYLSFGKMDIPVPALKTNKTQNLSTDLVDGAPLSEQLAQIEKQIITTCLERNRWHKGKVAAELKINPKTLYRKLKAFQISN